MRAAFFCSELSRARGEMLCGTAPEVENWILIEYPGPWSPQALESAALPDRVSQSLKMKRADLPRSRVLLIRQAYSRGEHLQCFFVACRERKPRITALEIDRWEDLLDIDFAAPRGERWKEPLFLVCTHGRHDRCCAKFGLPVYKALRKQEGARAWQCSHLGGDRFAGNMLCFPYGLSYGHVTPECGIDLADVYSRGELRLENYRGRACYSKVAQVGEYFIRKESGLAALDDLSFAAQSQVAPGTWRVEFGASGGGKIHTAEFVCKQNHFREYLTCHAAAQSSVTQYQLLSYR